MSTLSTEHKKSALAFLNDISADTFSEGDFGNWKFTSMSREGDQWRIGFTNSGAEGSDVMTFAFADECVDENGAIRQDWIDAVNNAVFRWEGEMRGEE